MTSVGIELGTRCRSCGTVVAINAFVSAVPCPACERRVDLDPTRWHLLLEEPLAHATNLPPNAERSAPFTTEDGTFHRVYRRTDPTCARCGHTIDPERAATLATRGAGYCSGCAAPLSFRPAPAELTRHGVVAIIAEDREQLGTSPPASEPVALACTSCGGGLQADGSARLVQCGYCHAQQYLPDELWKHFHPVKPISRFYLVFGAHAANAPATQKANWEELCDIIVDHQGVLYACGTHLVGNPEDESYEFAVWSMTPDLHLRWVRSGLKFDTWDTHIALAPSGHVLLWQKEKRTALVLSCADGSTAAKLSGKPGEAAALPMDDCEALLCDRDGTLLLVDEKRRLLRFTAMGEPIATWGTGAPERRPEENYGWLDSVKNRPLFLYSSNVGLGWDGLVCAYEARSSDKFVTVVKYDRDGKQNLMARVHTDLERWDVEQRPGVDAQGFIYLLLRDEHSRLCVWRVPPHGRGGEKWLDAQRNGGVLGREEKFAVTPNGTIWLFGDGGAARRFAPDRRTELITEASRKADTEAVEADDDE